MLTLPAFSLHQPSSVEEALAVLRAHAGEVKLLAGGTDLLPNLKHRLLTPAHLVSLRAIPGLSEIREVEGALEVGAMVSLAALAREPRVQRHFPSLVQAAASIAGPQLREMGTLGGNICLDTRCVYFNQTAFWRKSLGYCLKKDGTVCHVVKGGRSCVAAASNDTAPVLITLGATLAIAGAEGVREVPIADFFTADGVNNKRLGEDELLLRVKLPLPSGRVLAGYQKLRIRQAIDFPVLGVAVAARLDGAHRLQWVKVALNAMGARPQVLKSLESFQGRALDASAIQELGGLAHRQCHPLSNINVDPAWRRELIPVLVKRAFAKAEPQG